ARAHQRGHPARRGAQEVARRGPAGAAVTSPSPSSPMLGARPEGSLLVRVEADPQGGTGHAMRCIALAQAWQDAGGGAVRFLMTRCGEGLAARLRRERIAVEELEAARG